MKSLFVYLTIAMFVGAAAMADQKPVGENDTPTFRTAFSLKKLCFQEKTLTGVIKRQRCEDYVRGVIDAVNLTGGSCEASHFDGVMYRVGIYLSATPKAEQRQTPAAAIVLESCES